MRAVAARCAVAAACLAMLPPLQAGQTTRGSKTCVLEEASVMAFGVYDPVDNGPLDVQGRISYRCGTHVSRTARAAADPRSKLIVQISLSTGNSGRFDRYMRGSRDQLRYNLYLDGTRTQIWGDGTSGTEIYSAHAQPNNKVVTVPVFGRVFPLQDVSAGGYFDQLIVTMDF
jgi:spore coat protein U-like protein